MSETAPVTRFAPSPTGFLHIGGARTALFNAVYAHANGGRMLLRIEDTDRQRSSEDAVEAILDGLDWLGVPFDGEPVSQFARAERHREIAGRLLDAKRAYRCYATREELDEMREQQRSAGQPPRYDGRWRDRDPAEAPEGAPFVVRIRTASEGQTIVDDAVQGRVAFPNNDMDDFVILRADGTPTYMLAVVVDDHDMGVTQIIRGDDHLTNAARQAQIYAAMGWKEPGMAHIPLIHGADGAKLSKRHGALGVDAYRAMGFLPEAVRNYLLRLGWAHGDEEFFTTEQLDDVFGFAGMGKSPSRFDFTKLENMNGHYLRHAADEYLVGRLEELLPHIENGQWYAERWTAQRKKQLVRAMPGLKERAKTLLELLDGARFIFDSRPLPMEPKAQAMLETAGDEVRDILDGLRTAFEQLGDWNVDAIETVVRREAEALGLKLGKVAQPLRAALTGRTTSPGIFDVVDVLGRDEVVARLADQSNDGEPRASLVGPDRAG